MSAWSTADIPDQTGRTIVITGANSGLGAQATQALVGAGATVVMACRDLTKAQKVVDGLGSGGERVRIGSLDLADLASVRAFADTVDGADVLINNAGVMAVPLRRTVDGFEMQFGTNHLGHFALTGLLLPKISDRVVTVSSGAHQIGRIDLEDPDYNSRPYRRWSAYGQSKLANLLFGYELARRLQSSGSSIKSIVAHPGYADTGLQSHTESVWDRLMAVSDLVAQSAADGALPELYAATAADAQSGKFYGPTKFGGTRGAPGPAKSSRRSHDERTAAGLWALSEQLTGVQYAF